MRKGPPGRIGAFGWRILAVRILSEHLDDEKRSDRKRSQSEGRKKGTEKEGSWRKGGRSVQDLSGILARIVKKRMLTHPSFDRRAIDVEFLVVE